MTTYIPILNSEIDPESPVTESLAQRWRDNPIAIAEGDSAAPRINPGAISVGGKGADGVFDNSTTITGGPGFYEFTTIARSANIVLPVCTIMRIAGNSVWSGVVTVPHLSDGLPTASGSQGINEEKDKCEALGAIFGVDATANSVGGGSYGADGTWAGDAGFGSRGRKIDVNRYWSTRKPLIGGRGGSYSGAAFKGGGGALVLLVEGDLDLSSCTISADGQTGDASNGGGSGGGSIIVIATGTIKNGTFSARGGAGGGSGNGGGGGVIQLICSGFLGSQTISVAGGAGGSAGESGFALSSTVTADQIRTILQRL